jgi:hypothetical protein
VCVFACLYVCVSWFLSVCMCSWFEVDVPLYRITHSCQNKYFLFCFQLYIHHITCDIVFFYSFLSQASFVIYRVCCTLFIAFHQSFTNSLLTFKVKQLSTKPFIFRNIFVSTEGFSYKPFCWEGRKAQNWRLGGRVRLGWQCKGSPRRWVGRASPRAARSQLALTKCRCRRNGAAPPQRCPAGMRASGKGER